MDGGTCRSRMLRALGLQRRELRSWALYDWANSAFVTSVGVVILPLYFQQVAGRRSCPEGRPLVYWGYINSLALLLIAVASPMLGAVADFMGAKKRFLGLFVGLGVSATAGMYFRGGGGLGAGGDPFRGRNDRGDGFANVRRLVVAPHRPRG